MLTLRNFIWIGLLSLFSSVCFAQSPCVEVEGVAQIEQGDLAYARQMAIRDALAQAALSTNVRVNAQSETQNFTLTRQSAQFAAQQRVTSMKVLSEVQEGNTIRVSVSACLTDEAKVCPNYIARYVPKVAIASVAVQDEYSVKDILDVAPGYQGELFNRLWSSGQRNVELLHTASDLYVGRPIVPNLSSTMLQTASDRTLAQYLVLTVIRSAD
ncbi:MAG: flagellar assembly protein T N-terminal domain-containing protein, partial [Thiotrichales bacterium]